MLYREGRLSQKQFVSSIAYKALSENCCEILYEILDSSDPEVLTVMFK